MDRTDVIYLLHEKFETDELGQRVPKLCARPVYASVMSVTGSEWASGGQNGIRPELCVTMFRFDYQNEEIVNIGGCPDGDGITGGQNYTVYRTYFRPPRKMASGLRQTGSSDDIELYLERRTGS